jgi:group I intron endonuclease
MIGVYKITSPSRRVYIGSSVDIKRRFRVYQHINKTKKQIRLHNSFKKYGINNHIFEIIMECDKDNLYYWENYYGEKYDVLSINGLNLSLPKLNSVYGGHSEETKLKIKNSHLGKKFTEEHKIKLSETKKKTTIGSNNSFYGKTHTEEFKKYMSDSRIGSGNPNARTIIDLSNGIYYGCLEDASFSKGYNKNYLGQMIRGSKKNKTTFLYT